MRIAVLDDYQQVALTSADWGPVRDRGGDIVVVGDHIADEGELVSRLAEFDVIVAMRERTAFPAGVLDRLPALRLLVTTGAKNAAIDVPAARGNGVVLSGTGMSGVAAPELTWALLMALVRHVPAEDAAVRAGGWQHTVGLDLAGRTLGLLGLGRIGQRVAGYARAFDMEVLAWSQNLTAERAAEHGAQAVAKDELFERSDIVAITTVLSRRTRGIVGSAELALLGPAGYLVNTSRGPIVYEDALVAALAAGTIAGAALDVYDVEPLPVDHPLRTAPNTVLTPHIGYVTQAAYERMYADVVEDIAAFADGAPIRELE